MSTTPSTDEVTLYLVVRTDLKLSKGKLVAQTGHGVQWALRLVETHPDLKANPIFSQYLKDWESHSYPKVALKVDSETDFNQLSDTLTQHNIPHVIVTDEGRTEIPPGTHTVIATVPLPRSQTAPALQHLKLL